MPSTTVFLNEATHYNVDMLNEIYSLNINVTAVYLKKENNYGYQAHINKRLPEINFKVIYANSKASQLLLLTSKELWNSDRTLIWGYFPRVKILLILRAWISNKKLYIFSDSFPQKIGYNKLLQNIFRKFVLNFSEKVLVSGKQAYNEAINTGISKNKLEIMCYWFDSDRIKNKLKYARKPDDIFNNYPGAKIFVSSQLISRKGIDDLLYALSNLTNNNYCCKIEGTGPDELKLKALVSELKLNHKVEFIGYSDTFDHYYNILNSDIVCVPSKYDPWSIVVEEAMCLKKIVVATDNVGCAVHNIIDGENGFIVNSNDPNDLSKALQFVISNDNIWNDISANAVDSYNERSLEFTRTIKRLFL